ncbi:MAG: ABC transporter ATP-binding protein [Eubacterium sp.]|nr:ABC transporter ATP-binding protein [Eubacterium sp.]
MAANKPKQTAPVKNAVEIRHLTKAYGKARGITDITLSIPEGEFFGFIGPNGAGKSTTIHTLLGLLRADSGSASIFGIDIASRNQKALLSQTGYLPAESVFYPGMRVRDIIRFSAALRRTDCTSSAAGLCERLALDPSKKVEELSFGNRKKLGIVCALLGNPRLCIMDEPTSGLDPFIQREFFAILQERHQQGTTIFLSSHILSEIQRYCTRAAVIRAGSIIACDTVKALSQANARRVQFQCSLDPAHLAASASDTLGNIRDLHQAGHSISFLYGGDLPALLRFLAAYPIADLTIAEPDLEEIFMHYYTDPGSSPAQTEETTNDHYTA